MQRVAVLMSTYNGEKYLKEQIDSILAQKCECEIKLIVRDDGSTDKTISILEEYNSKGLLNYYSDINLGPGYSFLKMVIDNPGYDYYAFADQDDFWYEDKLQKAIEKVSNTNNYALYCSNTEMCDSNLVSLGRKVHKKMSYFTEDRVYLGLACAQGCTCVFNKMLADSVIRQGMPQNIVLHDSFITCLCFALEGEFCADEWVSMKYRMHGYNIGGLQTKSQVGILAMIKKRIRYIFEAPKKSIVDQLIYINRTYHDEMSRRSIDAIKNVYESKQSVFMRVRLACSTNLKDESLNLGVANRVKILLGNY